MRPRIRVVVAVILGICAGRNRIDRKRRIMAAAIGSCIHGILDRVAGAGKAATVDGFVGPAGSCSAGVASISISGNNRKSEGNRSMM